MQKISISISTLIRREEQKGGEGKKFHPLKSRGMIGCFFESATI